MTGDESSVELKLAAEEFDDSEFLTYHKFSDSDEKVLRRLIIPGPVLLRGPRGSGKSAYMRMAHEKIKKSGANTASCYVSLRYLPLLTASAENYLQVLIPFISERINSDLTNVGYSGINLAESLSLTSLGKALNEWCIRENKRLVLLFDDAAHIGREVSLSGFFDFFRTISSSLISCKASIYPGVTRFGSRFDIYNDATIVEAQRDERAADFGEFFRLLLDVRYARILERAEPRLQPILPKLMGRAVLGNIRSFYALCEQLKDEERITVHTVSDKLKWLASDHLYPALDELQTKLGAYVPMLAVAHEIAPKFFSDCGQTRVNSMLVHKDNVQKLGKVFEILEYVGFMAKREASRVLTKSGAGRGPRYALSLGPLVEQIPRLTPSYDLFEEITRVSIPNDQIVEYPSHSFLDKFSIPESESDDSIEILDLPISALKTSQSIPYGLTSNMIDSLTEHGYKTISDIASLTVDDLKQVKMIGRARALRIKSAVEQAIWM